MENICTIISAFLLVQSAIAVDVPANPLKILIVAGQSNMQGWGIVAAQDKDGSERPGLLVFMMHNPAKAPQLKHLVNAKSEWEEKR